ncbi:hypothetical protein GCK72_014763 [Caenorhabditis remanei]|uniref:Uncharacterized protein n=1 Tax=Caenorhabditis remanei TaxID=31234 RepID=A0A6A5GUY7_CAERE|nr:hypothetical protein GCK72_014763 [Caenorhabditis remanei]KAF1758305.1 hypothetical protein GCK72_014763 [Caenorhabditis remanei]
MLPLPYPINPVTTTTQMTLPIPTVTISSPVIPSTSTPSLTSQTLANAWKLGIAPSPASKFLLPTTHGIMKMVQKL